MSEPTGETREARVNVDELRRLLAVAAHHRSWNALAEFGAHGSDLLNEIERLREIENAAREVERNAGFNREHFMVSQSRMHALRAALGPVS